MILITGSGGLLGSACYEYFSHDYSVTGTSLRKTQQENFFECDLTSEEQVKSLFEHVKPSVVIHTAAIKDINLCENDKEACEATNVRATQLIAQLCKDSDAFLVYISTDYVFDGNKGMYSEIDEPHPQLNYGVTKAQAEKRVLEIGGAVCRTSGLYSWDSRAPTFVEFVYKELKEGNTLDLFEDSFNSPTYVMNLCHMLGRVIDEKKGGVFHTAGCERINRYEFGKKIAKAFGFDESLLKPVPTPASHALRPKDVSLEVSTTQKLLKAPFLNVDEGLEQLKRDFHVRS